MADETNTFRESDLTLNNGNTFHVSSIFSEWRRIGGEDWIVNSYTDNLKEKSSIVDLSMYCPNTILDSNVLSKVFQNENNQKDMSYYETLEYSTFLTQFKQYSNFIWGSYDDGGVFIYKRTSTKYDMYIYNGFFKNESTNKYFNEIGFLGSYTENQLKGVVFFWDAWSMTQRTSWEGALYLKMGYNTGDTIDIASYRESEGAWAYRWMLNYQDVNLATWSVTCSIDWERNLLTDARFPKFAWKDMSIRDFFGPSNFDNYTHVSGSAYPNDEIDWKDEPYADDGFAGDGGGGANIDHTSDPDDTSNPEGMSVDVCSTGLVKMYNPTSGELSALNTFLFSGLSDSIANTLKKLTSEPMNYIISLAMYHFTPNSSTAGNIMFGGIDSGVTANIINKQYKTINCGTVHVPTQLKSFLDYGGYSVINLFLPYVGFVPLDINECMGSNIKVVYGVDLLSGACNVEVHITRNARSSQDDNIQRILYTFSGNCSLQVPMSSLDQRGLVQSIINVSGSAIGGLASGNPAGAIAGGLSSAVQEMTTEKQTVHRGSGISSNIGFMGKQKPYLVLGRPLTSVPVNFGAFEGWTSNKRMKVANIKGYTEIDPDTIWSDNFGHATAEECDMIKTIMNGGVYL